MANFVKDSNQLLDMQNMGGGLAINCPFVIVISDGRLNKDNVRRYMREAKEKRYLYIFVILDKVSDKGGKASTKDKASIYNMRSAVKVKMGPGQKEQLKLMPYLKDFPFDYYCVIQDIEDLPNQLGTILV